MNPIRISVRFLSEYSVKGARPSALLSLEELAARQLLATRRNFYAIPSLPPRLKDYLTQIAQTIEVGHFSYRLSTGTY
jgi:hypothetical protein